MILLVTSSNRRVECGKSLEQTVGESVEVCENVRKAASMLRNNEYSTVILDDPMVEAEGDALESATLRASRVSSGWRCGGTVNPG